VIPQRLAELWEDLAWGARRTLRRLAAPPRSRQAAIRRRRTVALVGLALILYAVFRFVPVPGLSCEVSPAKTCSTPDHAIELVPANAEAYVHVDLDRGSSQFATAESVAAKLPHSTAIAQGLFSGLGPAPRINFRRDVAPWVGDEAGFAFLGPGQPRPLALLAIADRAGVRRFLARLGNGKPRLVRNGGAAYHVYRNGLAFAEPKGFLAIGPSGAVGSVARLARGGGQSLADSPHARTVRGPLPAQRFADVYFSGAGVKRLLTGRGGLSSQLDTFVNFRASTGIAAALVAHGDGFEMQLYSALDPVKEKLNPSFFAAFPSFDPGLAGEFSAGTLLYLNFPATATTVPALLREVGTVVPGLAGAATRFQSQVRRGGFNVQKDLIPVLTGEAAVGLAPGRAAPYLTAAFNDVDEDRTRVQMAQLQGPLATALSAARAGQAPSFGTADLDGTTLNSVRISQTLDLAYAISGGKLVASTNPAGVAQALQGGDDLAGSDAYKAVTGGASGGVSALVFLNLEGLVRRAEPFGLGQIVGGFGADVAKLKGLGLTVKSDEDSLKTTIFVDIE
jgi:hypothetical protein